MAETQTWASEDARARSPRKAAALPAGTHAMRVVLGIDQTFEEGEMEKRATTKKAAKKPAAKRELIAPRGTSATSGATLRAASRKAMSVSRSLSQDRRRKAKKAAKSGQGDRGDRKPASKTPARKKTRAKR